MVHRLRYPYRVFYAVGDDTIDVLHIRHTARSAPKGFNEPPQPELVRG